MNNVQINQFTINGVNFIINVGEPKNGDVLIAVASGTPLTIYTPQVKELGPMGGIEFRVKDAVKLNDTTYAVVLYCFAGTASDTEELVLGRAIISAGLLVSVMAVDAKPIIREDLELYFTSQALGWDSGRLFQLISEKRFQPAGYGQVGYGDPQAPYNANRKNI